MADLSGLGAEDCGLSSLAAQKAVAVANNRNKTKQNLVILGAFLDAKSGECYHQDRS
jgi:hypothetical protein